MLRDAVVSIADGESGQCTAHLSLQGIVSHELFKAGMRSVVAALSFTINAAPLPTNAAALLV
jgi:hypothetical protein